MLISGRNLKYRVQHYILLFLIVIFSIDVNAELKKFDSRSLKAIESQHKNGAFLLAVWSIDCIPCRQELGMLSELKNEYPKLDFITVATDSYVDADVRAQLEMILAEHQLEGGNNWAFNNSNSAKLRYALDPTWYGELPRAYFYSVNHKRFPVSGKLSKKKVISWWENTAKNRKQ